MFKLKHILNSSLRMKIIETLKTKANTRCIQESFFVSEDEIMENILGKFITIGINIPETKNLLTETALEKLNDSLKNFDSNNEIHVAVLHGSGGNFCSGIVETDGALELSQTILKTLHTLKKPIIAAMDGYTTDFGLYLALMCDFRVLDKSALAGIRDKAQKFEIPLFMYERLVKTIGLSRAFEVVSTRQTWRSGECLTMGLINKIADSGCALGQSMLLAQNIVFNSSLETIIEQKSKILSFINTKL